MKKQISPKRSTIFSALTEAQEAESAEAQEISSKTQEDKLQGSDAENNQDQVNKAFFNSFRFVII